MWPDALAIFVLDLYLATSAASRVIAGDIKALFAARGCSRGQSMHVADHRAGHEALDVVHNDASLFTRSGWVAVTRCARPPA
jgi:hypothetical protein